MVVVVVVDVFDRKEAETLDICSDTLRHLTTTAAVRVPDLFAA